MEKRARPEGKPAPGRRSGPFHVSTGPAPGRDGGRGGRYSPVPVQPRRPGRSRLSNTRRATRRRAAHRRHRFCPLLAVGNEDRGHVDGPWSQGPLQRRQVRDIRRAPSEVTRNRRKPGHLGDRPRPGSTSDDPGHARRDNRRASRCRSDHQARSRRRTGQPWRSSTRSDGQDASIVIDLPPAGPPTKIGISQGVRLRQDPGRRLGGRVAECHDAVAVGPGLMERSGTRMRRLGEQALARTRQDRMAQEPELRRAGAASRNRTRVARLHRDVMAGMLERRSVKAAARYCFGLNSRWLGPSRGLTAVVETTTSGWRSSYRRRRGGRAVKTPEEQFVGAPSYRCVPAAASTDPSWSARRSLS